MLVGNGKKKPGPSYIFKKTGRVQNSCFFFVRIALCIVILLFENLVVLV